VTAKDYWVCHEGARDSNGDADIFVGSDENGRRVEFQMNSAVVEYTIGDLSQSLKRSHVMTWFIRTFDLYKRTNALYFYSIKFVFLLCALSVLSVLSVYIFHFIF